MIRGLTAIGIALLVAAAGAAPIYKTTDANGNVVYTDDPGDRPATALELPELTIVPATPITGPTPGSTETRTVPEPAPNISLLEPEAEATVRFEYGRPRDRGTRGSAPRGRRTLRGTHRRHRTRTQCSGVFALTGIDRGAHSVDAVRLVDAETGEVRASSESHTALGRRP